MFRKTHDVEISAIEDDQVLHLSVDCVGVIQIVCMRGLRSVF